MAVKLAAHVLQRMRVSSWRRDAAHFMPPSSRRVSRPGREGAWAGAWALRQGKRGARA
ncbi:hypothetical protein RAA17_19015 [Komagataeibacter rhaeticus]|nr:hypothetical protein [Komagataeibacter rhaeticus]